MNLFCQRCLDNDDIYSLLKIYTLLSLSLSNTSLFGSPSSRSGSIIASHKMKAKKQSPAKKASISLMELQRIKQSAQQQQQQNEDGNRFNTNKPSQSEEAKARKEYMKQLELKELEEQRKMGSQLDNEKLERIRKQAQEKIDDEQDIVKLLKTCSERATTFAIRDQQLKDKAERDRKEHDYEQRMIIAMEIDRLKEIETREAEDEQKLKKMVNDRKIIENQIEERYEARLLREEARDQENREMLERIQLYQQQDEEKARARKESAAKARTEIIRVNEEDIASKRERKMLEKREDEMMVVYQMEQDEKMRQREAEEAEAERKKREIQKKLLDAQERTMDRRSEMDELRARRAMEDAERKYRQKKLMEAQKKKRDMETMDMAQKSQLREKDERQQMEMQLKKEEYDNAIQHSHSMAERERTEAEFRNQKNNELIQNLQQQIDENEIKRKQLLKDKYHEGALLKQQIAEDKARLEAARDAMVKDLQTKNIPELYFSEISNLDLNKFL